MNGYKITLTEQFIQVFDWRNEIRIRINGSERVPCEDLHREGLIAFFCHQGPDSSAANDTKRLTMKGMFLDFHFGLHVVIQEFFLHGLEVSRDNQHIHDCSFSDGITVCSRGKHAHDTMIFCGNNINEIEASAMTSHDF